MKSSRAVDVELFSNIVDEALAAFEEDVSYAVSMMRSATGIAHKRAVWKVRLELKKSEKESVAQCAEAEPFVCENISPCGTGSCKYASGDLTLLNITPNPRIAGKTERPQESNSSKYNLEDAVLPLYKMRKMG